MKPFPIRLPGCRRLLRAAILGALLAPLFLIAGCKDDSSDDDLYAAISSPPFTFHESDPARNVIEVRSNTAWQVYWTPERAAVEVSPASGSGNGSFTLTRMPAGTTVQLGVRAVAGASGQPIAVTRAATPVVELSLSPATLVFDPGDAAANVISVTSNASWSASPSDPALRITPASGSGNGRITVEAIPAGSTYTLRVTAGEGKDAVAETVTVTRPADPGPAAETVFNLDFGNGRGGVWADSDAAWKTQTGTGAGTVDYAMARMRINNDNFGSAGKYTGASGAAYAKIFTDGDPGYFTIRNISLPDGVKDFTLSFGTIFPAGDMALSVSADGRRWQPLAYTGASSYNTWTRASVGFTLGQAAETLFIRFAVTGVERQYGLNFDDVTLTTGGGGQQVDFGPAKEYRWAELPATPADMTDRKINTYWSMTVTSGQYVRNYTYCYDTRRHCPLWIAHPQHACYQEGGFTRPAEDPWAPAPEMTQAEQAIVWIWPGDGGSKYVVSESPLFRWTRGHMLPSGYRGCGDRNNPAQINIQTFYAANIAPQGGADFESLWSQAERGIQDNYVCRDTLYCVSGAHFADDNLMAYDGSWIYDGRRYGIDAAKRCVVPTHYYKLVLRTRNGNTGKPVQACDASELKAVGFWFANGDGNQGAGTSPTLDASYLRSVEWIERQTGFTFFPDVPAEVKSRAPDPAEWGF